VKNITAIGLATLTVILNGLIGHFFAPNGILLTPIVLTLTTSLIAFRRKNIKVIWITVWAFLFVALNDIIIKLYSGGRHDNEGLGWVHLLLFVGLIPSYGILVTTIFRRKDEKMLSKVIAVVLFLILIAVHLQLFSSLGLGRSYWYNWNG
jgi:hypothetical protein